MKEDKFDELGPLFVKLVEIVARLRGPGGCPWDQKQTPETLKKYVLEEAYEVFEAIGEEPPLAVCEEIGDLLFLLIFIAYLYEEKGEFELAHVLKLCAEKMIRRHPHVFGENALSNPEEVVAQWQKIKEKEAKDKGKKSSVLGDLPKALPALQRAFRLGERASRVGFDWEKPEELFPKLEEEIREIKEAIAQKDEKSLKEEIGDLLFTVANLSRKLGINPEEALRHSNEKFETRFRSMESHFKEKGKRLKEVSLKEMDAVWEELKK
ncbi:nucleoside triphosphate pyrophosphohydrolase [Thermodesulfatator autotrophicus]|uniref:Nucleoside triphosphate pyrophosphohydrolase n=1 Tax=Thermodesulfatator autotrophicus TaxID=1795632 RepID=A0A177E637_9BACT|nr:nucleoside triphosphate pyrophosphohydrolase [Thermodesulfatator autotrophicus]OAG26692.1 nucleoside triphosphate hydrolase [Thermodesulfatator autotrophicus]